MNFVELTLLDVVVGLVLVDDVVKLCNIFFDDVVILCNLVDL